MLKTCPICNKEFIAGKGNVKFCSDICRKQAEYARHRDWADRTNYAEKKRLEMRQRRQKEAEIHQEHLRQMHEERLKQIEEDKKRADQELRERAGAGDYKALMALAPDKVTYYKYYALNEIETEERDYKRRSTREINGISVYDPDFAILVVKSIEETGRCINKTNGLGAKIEP